MFRLAIIAVVSLMAASSNAQTSQLDDQAWNQALSANQAAGFERYLMDHPAGRHASLAFRCMIEFQLLAPDDGCSLARPEPGPPGPVRVDIGNLPVSIR